MGKILDLIENSMRKYINLKNRILNNKNLKNRILNNKITKNLNNYILMDKIDKNVKNQFIETSKEILEKANLEKKELEQIITRLDNLVYTEKSNIYYLNEISNTFFYDFCDLRIHTLEYKEYYKNEINELKKEISFECGKAIDWIGTKPPKYGCEYLRPIICHALMNDFKIDQNEIIEKIKIRKDLPKVIKSIEIAEKIIENGEIKECILKKTLKYDKTLINILKQK